VTFAAPARAGDEHLLVARVDDDRCRGIADERDGRVALARLLLLRRRFTCSEEDDYL
jgi:hypothetical protein